MITAEKIKRSFLRRQLKIDGLDMDLIQLRKADTVKINSLESGLSFDVEIEFYCIDGAILPTKNFDI